MRFSLAAAVFAAAMSSFCAARLEAQPRIQPPSGAPPSQGSSAPTGGLMQGTTPDATAQSLQQAGFSKVEMVTVEGQRQVRGEINGSTVVAWHYQCNNGPCASLTLLTSFGRQASIDSAWINAWNRDKRFGRLFLDKQGNVVFSMDVHFFGGTGPEYLRMSGVLFGSLLKALLEFQPS